MGYFAHYETMHAELWGKIKWGSVAHRLLKIFMCIEIIAIFSPSFVLPIQTIFNWQVQ